MSGTSEWQTGLGAWAREQLANGASGLLNDAVPTFERVMIDAALERSGGRIRDAAELLGWGRNTLTRKLRKLNH